MPHTVIKELPSNFLTNGGLNQYGASSTATVLKGGKFNKDVAKVDVHSTIETISHIKPFLEIKTITANYTVTEDDLDKLLLLDGSSNTVQVTFPVATSMNNKAPIHIMSIDITNACTAIVSGGGNINGSATFTFNPVYTSGVFVSNGTQWFKL